MCGTCGCADDAEVTGHGHTVVLEQKVLARNDELAEADREWLAARDIRAVNLMSSPGSGKTTLLERTIRELGGSLTLSVVEGDQETAVDADRIRAAGAAAIQVNTGAGCHLDATMLARALRTLDPPPHSLVCVENVGNLVCPALFESSVRRLNREARLLQVSATRGDGVAGWYGWLRQSHVPWEPDVYQV